MKRDNKMAMILQEQQRQRRQKEEAERIIIKHAEEQKKDNTSKKMWLYDKCGNPTMFYDIPEDIKDDEKKIHDQSFEYFMSELRKQEIVKLHFLGNPNNNNN
jgi:hypothetical protein